MNDEDLSRNNPYPNAKDRQEYGSIYFYALDVDKCPRIDHAISENKDKYLLKCFFVGEEDLTLIDYVNMLE